jgi:hypothetical protein
MQERGPLYRLALYKQKSARKHAVSTHAQCVEKKREGESAAMAAVDSVVGQCLPHSVVPATCVCMHVYVHKCQSARHTVHIGRNPSISLSL